MGSGGWVYRVGYITSLDPQYSDMNDSIFKTNSAKSPKNQQKNVYEVNFRWSITWYIENEMKWPSFGRQYFQCPSWMKVLNFKKKSLNYVAGCLLTMNRHSIRWRPGTKQATSRYLNQCRPSWSTLVQITACRTHMTSVYYRTITMFNINHFKIIISGTRTHVGFRRYELLRFLKLS